MLLCTDLYLTSLFKVIMTLLQCHGTLGVRNVATKMDELMATWLSPQELYEDIAVPIVFGTPTEVRISLCPSL